MNPKLVFLDWKKPWVNLLADWLWAEPERLRRRLVVTPTRESGRRLREVLLEKTMRKGSGAMLGPRLATPDDFFRPEQAMADSVRWAGWVQVLRGTQDELVASLFPGGVSQQEDGWRVGVARQIEQARETLASVNAGFDSVGAALPAEAQRWSELAALERQVQAQWKQWGFEDPVGAKLKRALAPRCPPGVEEVVVAGVADPTRLAVEAWSRLLAQGIGFTVLVGAPKALRAAFDEWGRPQAEFWSERTRHATPEPSQSFVAAEALGLAEAVVQACAAKSNQEVAIGVCDGAFMPAIARRFQEAGWSTFEPQAALLAREGWPALLEALAGAVEAPEEHAAIARVARHPTVWAPWLKDYGARAVFAALEQWEKRHSASEAGLVIERLTAQRCGPELQAAGQLLKAVRALVIEAQEGKSAPLERQLFQWLGQEAPELLELLDAETQGWKSLERLAFPLALRLRWLGASLASAKRSGPAPDGVVALQGWLELPYEPAAHLVLAGMHEGSVPEAPGPNPLLSEMVREKLGLRDRKSRLAREVFLYTALVEGRRAAGSVCVVTAQSNPQGEPCRPSRVLLHATPQELPGRVLALVKETPDVPLQPTPPWARGDWRLRLLPEAKANKAWQHLSPSTLRAYLECPTRFYFTKVLGWEQFEPFQQELDGGAFGDLLHKVFCRWAQDTDAREFTQARQLKACWLELLKGQVAEQFGKELPPLLQLQVMSAQERLGAFAEKQAQQRQEGWQLIAFEQDYKSTIQLAGLPVVMRVDRVDRHEDGRVRVIDYKTAKKAWDPRKAHLLSWPQEQRPQPLGPLLTIKGKPYGWADLQLPLYVHAVQTELKLTELPQAWYALLPEAVSEIEFREFEQLDGVIDSALGWAQEAAKRIQAGVFWAPAPEVKYDLFEAIAPEGLQQALGPEWAAFLSTPSKGGPAQ